MVHLAIHRDLEIFRIDIHKIRDEVAVDRLEHPLVEHQLDHVAAGEDQVVAGRAGFQLGVHGLVGVKGVDDHLAAVLLLELLDELRLHVVRPVVDVQDRLATLAPAGQAQQRNDDDRDLPHVFSSARRWLNHTAANVTTSRIVERALMSGGEPCLIML